MLSLLDLSAAFDTVDHHTLLQRLRTSYGLNGVVIKWLTSYLTGLVSDIAIFVLKRDVKLQLTN